MNEHPYVCADCFLDDALRRFVAEQAVDDRCGYCGRYQPGTAIAAPVEDVIELIEESLESEWTDPVDELPWDSSEGGWQLGRVFFTGELFADIEDTFANSAIEDEVVGALGGDRQWVEVDFVALRRHEALILGWENFAQWVIAQTTGAPSPWSEDDSHDQGEIPPYKVLEEVAKVVSQVALDITLPAAARLWRARRHTDLEPVTNGSGLGSPPAKFAVANRMSRAGVPMFYGAVDRATALIEARGSEPLVTVGQFETARDLRVIDLTRLPEIPSLYDRSKRHLRAAVIFLKSFAGEVSKRIQPGHEIEYVPTQVVTDFFRDQYRGANGEVVLGILYASAQGPGSCCVLFFDNAACTDIANHWANAPDKWLGLDLKTLEPAP